MKLSKITIRKPSAHNIVHYGHSAAHCTYLGAAAFHGGIYGIAAAILLVLVIVGMFLGENLA